MTPTVDVFPAHPHVWSVAVQIVGLTVVALAALHVWREARRARRVERVSEAQRAILEGKERERLEHRLALARTAQRLAAAHALGAEIEALPIPAETLR